MPSILAPDCHTWCHAKNCLLETFTALLQDTWVPEINYFTWIFNMISLKNDFASKYFVKSGLESLQGFWCSQSSIFVASTFSGTSQSRWTLNTISTHPPVYRYEWKNSRTAEWIFIKFDLLCVKLTVRLICAFLCVFT